jgi:hypothetical protein
LPLALRLQLQSLPVISYNLWCADPHSYVTISATGGALRGAMHGVFIKHVANRHSHQLWLLQIEMKLMMETDPSEILNEIIYATRKGGYIGIGAPQPPN